MLVLLLLTVTSVLSVDSEQFEAVVRVVDVTVDLLFDVVLSPVRVIDIETGSQLRSSQQKQDGHSIQCYGQ